MSATAISPNSVRLPADELPLNAGANRPTLGRTLTRIALYALALTISLFFLVPIYLIAISAFSPQQAIFAYPKPLIPTTLSADTMLFFWNARGVQQSLINSVLVGIMTLTFALLVGAPAGYALARFFFRGRDSFKLLILTTRAFPIVILAIPLAVNYIQWNLYDTLWGVALAHTAMALPTTILVTSSIFVGVSRELEEAAQTLGCNRAQAFIKVALPLALPGLAAAAIFTFVLSWNETFAATILTQRNRTLPALVLSQIADVGAPLPFRFAAGFFLIAPSLLFIFFMRRYLLGMWGQVVK
ncbi:MAG TPA: carbohydrate ABC transporter permease [Anaerolineae bacterium]|nr:carbohydrate ABC transporter permease [Anaerolineae bacterium]